MKLGTKIFLVIFVLMLIVSSLTGVLVYMLNRVQTEISVGQTQLSTAVATLDTIDRFFSERYGDIQVFTRPDSIKEYLAQSTSTNSAPIEDELNSLINIYGAWDAFMILRLDGTISITTDKKYTNTVVSPQFVKDHELFLEALQGDIVYSDLFLSSLTNKPTVAFAAPIRSQTGDKEVVGVGLGYVDWNIVEEIISLTQLDAYLFNAEGMQIAGSIAGDHSFVQSEDHHPGVLNALQGISDSELLFDEARNEQVLLSYAAEAGYFDYRGNGWVLLLEQTTNEVFANAKKNAYLIAALFTTGGMVLAAGAIFLLNKLVIDPIFYLTRVTKKIADGDLDERVPIHSNDELGVLANVFNGMAESIKNSQANLETKVLERTASLDQKIEQLDTLNKHMIGRELRMVELKKEIAKLKEHTTST